jgi:hypothetical protein
MNEAACNMQAETKNPQNQQDYKDRPEHRLSLFLYSRASCLKRRCAAEVNLMLSIVI